MLSLKNVSKTFGNILALDSFSLTVPQGRTTVLIGPSGCGKSTILRLIIGLAHADRGSVEFDGIPVGYENVIELRRKMGYVIQEGGLFPHLTAKENITIMASFLDWIKNAIEVRVLELTDLTQFPINGLDRYPAQLSGGQRQRVSLMRALMLNPQILLLDEPLGALDPMIRADLQEMLRNIFRKLNKTVLMVTHDMGEAAFFGDIIVLMREGRIIQQGVPRSFIQNPADPFVTKFINAQRNQLESLVRNQ